MSFEANENFVGCFLWFDEYIVIYLLNWWISFLTLKTIGFQLGKEQAGIDSKKNNDKKKTWTKLNGKGNVKVLKFL